MDMFEVFNIELPASNPSSWGLSMCRHTEIRHYIHRLGTQPEHIQDLNVLTTTEQSLSNTK